MTTRSSFSGWRIVSEMHESQKRYADVTKSVARFVVSLLKSKRIPVTMPPQPGSDIFPINALYKSVFLDK